MKNKAKLLATATSLAALAFFAAVGFMNFVFVGHTDGFIPKQSGDAAAWVQAIGSVFAIYFSFQLGAWQMKEAQRQADISDAKERSRIEAGYRSVVEQLHKAGSDLFDVIAFQDHRQLKLTWSIYLGAMTAASLAAFQAIPVHDLGNAMRIRAAFKLYAAIQTMYGRAEAAYAGKREGTILDHNTVLVEGAAQRILFNLAWKDFQAAYGTDSAALSADKGPSSQAMT